MPEPAGVVKEAHPAADGAPLLQSENAFLPEKAVEEALRLASEKNYEIAIELLELVAEREPRWKGIDRVYFLLGSFYEKESSRRSASKSVGYYSRIVEDYPLSDYVNEAEKRIIFLKKYFIHIR